MSQPFLKILFLGDIFGEPGRRILTERLPSLREKLQPDLIIANCENAANGKGISTKLVREILNAGVDFMTGGNHIFQVDEVYGYLNDPACKIVRACNFPQNSPGRGWAVITTKSGIRVGMISVMGQKYMDVPVDLPFDAVDRALETLKDQTDVNVIDIHAEATSEKRALAWYLDGRVQLIVGTHTHVQTADEEILPKGSAYITDVGMCGPFDSVIGMQKEIILKRIRLALPEKFEVAKGDVRINAVVCEVDVEAKRAVRIERVDQRSGSVSRCLSV